MGSLVGERPVRPITDVATGSGGVGSGAPLEVRDSRSGSRGSETCYLEKPVSPGGGVALGGVRLVEMTPSTAGGALP